MPDLAAKIEIQRKNLCEAGLCAVGIVAILVGPETQPLAIILLGFFMAQRISAALRAREAGNEG